MNYRDDHGVVHAPCPPAQSLMFHGHRIASYMACETQAHVSFIYSNDAHTTKEPLTCLWCMSRIVSLTMLESSTSIEPRSE